MPQTTALEIGYFLVSVGLKVILNLVQCLEGDVYRYFLSRALVVLLFSRAEPTLQLC